MLTLDILKMLPPGTIFAKGVTTNDPAGIFMTREHPGRKMIWLAKRGGIHDWAIYISWEELGYEQCERSGDKVMGDDNILKLVPADAETLKHYRR